jgi:transcriptional regulator with PAS, ATPase and Fis domain
MKLDLKSIHTAISPAMGHLCPKGIDTLIDIGPRLLSMQSFSNLLVSLELDSTYLEDYAKYYHYFLLETSRQLSKALAHAELLRTRSAVILNEFDEGIISVNTQGRVDLTNKAADKLLASSHTSLSGSRFNDVMARFEKVADLIDETNDDNKSAEIYNYHDTQLVVSKIPVISGQTRSHLYTYRKIASIQNLEKDVRVKLAEKGHTPKYSFRDIWGISSRLKDLIEKATSFAHTEKSILVVGESGTGKELLAHAIHRNSLRQDGPFVAINFAGISESLIESELFGYVEGAFTGAKKGGTMGLFEQAHGGTIFLDEIGAASPGVQSRLLRVLQEQEVRRVGGSKIIPINVRVIAATNADLYDAMTKGDFREDLYYRLGTLPIHIPPLRERSEDILHIFHKFQKTNYNINKGLRPDAKRSMLAYPWPGNVRELINTAEYTLITSKGSRQISHEHLPDVVQRHASTFTQQNKSELPSGLREVVTQIQSNQLDPEITTAILQILADRVNHGVGRNTLLYELTKLNLATTEGRIKRILMVFKACGLVQVGHTRQGTQITSRGKQFLEYINQNQMKPMLELLG